MATLQGLAKTYIHKMKTLEDRIEAAWQKSRGEEPYDPNYPVKASQNFIDGYLAGAKEALANQWCSVEDGVPQEDGLYITVTQQNETYFTELALWENGKYRGVAVYGVNRGFVKVTHWLSIPPLISTE